MLKRYLSYLWSCYCISPLRKKQVGANQQNYDEKEFHDHSRRSLVMNWTQISLPFGI